MLIKADPMPPKHTIGHLMDTVAHSTECCIFLADPVSPHRCQVAMELMLMMIGAQIGPLRLHSKASVCAKCGGLRISGPKEFSTLVQPMPAAACLSNGVRQPNS
ncbi:Selenium-binding protein 1-A [Anopheles sinensis]|uniref:Selenium-binding protein 1-A n=1 Tax=Anopheles sinensis TaxID=74873 RepID=A0A084VUJ8_ANOSI|nr:Selenium-binding protein 1-A [Anopheles sinensis]